MFYFCLAPRALSSKHATRSCLQVDAMKLVGEAVFLGAVDGDTEKERSINRGSSSVVTVDTNSDIERDRNVVGIMKKAGVARK